MFSGTNPEKEILISSFSHKGGVGKTTGAYNIACVLAKEFKCKVLLIDADPQSNLTSVVMHQKFRELGRQASLENPANVQKKQNYEKPKKKRKGLTKEEKEIEKERISEEAQRGEEIFYESGVKTKRNTLYKCFQTISGEFSQVADEKEILRRVEEEIEVEKIGEYGDLFFLPGDLQVLTLDNDLNKGFAFGGQPGFGAFAKYPGTISRLFRAIANKCGANIILVDLNPNASALNQAIVMGSDYFLVSNLADFYSRRAINSISHVIDDWNKSTIPFRNVERTTPFFKMPDSPKFLGYLFHRVKIRGGNPTLGQKKRIKLIEDEVEQKIILTLPEIVTSNYQPRKGGVVIKEFDRTAGEAVESGIPMAYVDFNKLEDKTNLRKTSVDQQQEFYLNAYFGAIRVLFRGLSDEHHRIFGDRFKNLVLPPRTTIHHTTPKSSQAKRHKKEQEPLLTGFLNEFPIYFKVQPNIGAGNCSILALGVEREEVGSSLRQGINNPDIRNLLEQEIYQACCDDLKTARFNELYEIHNMHSMDYENHKNKLVQRFAEFENISEEEKITKATALGDDPDAVAFLTASRQSEQARNELRNYLQERETVELFINEIVLKNHKWLGTKTLRAYARINNLSLRIWKRSDHDQNRVEINNQEQPEIGNGRTIDILYTHGNHFEALRLQPAPQNNPLLMNVPPLMLSGGPHSTQASSSQANSLKSKARGQKRKAPA